jgi:hypothetical protein
MNDARDDSPGQPRRSTEVDGSTLAASSSESGGLYDDDGATISAPDGVPISDEDDEAPQGEAPDIPDIH